MDDQACHERLENCKLRMNSQADDIQLLFNSKASKSILYWTLGIFFVLIIGAYGYTQTVAQDIKGIVTKTDMEKYQKEIIQTIKEVSK